MRRHPSLLITGVLMVVLVLFITPILIGLDRVVRDGGRLAAARTDEHAVWLLLAGLSVSIVVAGYVLAAYQARRLTRPMARLRDIAQLCGQGESFEPLAPTGIVEIDQLAGTFQSSAFRVKEAILLERQFNADVSHQLRTPLASLRLKLDALDPVRWPPQKTQPFRNDLLQMERTIDHLLHLDRATARLDSVVVVDDVIRRALQRWQPILTRDARPIRVVEGQSAVVQGSAIVFDQVLDVLISNAHRHGHGTVTVAIRSLLGGTAIDVQDEGTGLVAADAEQIFRRGVGEHHGLGLSIARTLAETEGARLIVTNLLPTTFSLVALNAVEGVLVASHGLQLPTLG
jgi:signal transduction histidine kinase